jgi:hypothetical protein
MATDYNAINFKNKDVDKFSSKFNKDKEPKTTTETSKNIFGRKTTYTQTGKDNDNTFNETVTNRKGRVVKETTGEYKEKNGQAIVDKSTTKKFNKAGDVKVKKSFESVGPDKNYTYKKTVERDGQLRRKREGVYQENKTNTVDKGSVSRMSKDGLLQTRVYDRSTGNINEKYPKSKK